MCGSSAWRRTAVGVAVAAMLVAAALELPGIVRAAVDEVRDGRPAEVERNAAPADGLGIPNDMLERAREVIPEDAHYAVVLGPSIPLDANQTVGIPQFLRYWLLPRTFEDEADDADWVIAYGQSAETLGVPVRREVALAELVNAVEVDR